MGCRCHGYGVLSSLVVSSPSLPYVGHLKKVGGQILAQSQATTGPSKAGVIISILSSSKFSESPEIWHCDRWLSAHPLPPFCPSSQSSNPSQHRPRVERIQGREKSQDLKSFSNGGSVRTRFSLAHAKLFFRINDKIKTTP